MSNNLVSFLVENNYAPNEISALKILCCVSSSFYEDLVCESMAMNPQQRREYNELMAKKAAGKATPADLSKIEKLLGTLSRQSEVRRRADTREAGREVLHQMTGRSKAPSSSGDSETPPPGLDALLADVRGTGGSNLSPQTQQNLAARRDRQRRGLTQLPRDTRSSVGTLPDVSPRKTTTAAIADRGNGRPPRQVRVHRDPITGRIQIRGGEGARLIRFRTDAGDVRPGSRYVRVKGRRKGGKGGPSKDDPTIQWNR